MKKLFIPICIALLFCSCEQEQDLATPGATAATFLPAMESRGAAAPGIDASSTGTLPGALPAATRATDNRWSGTETVGVAAFDASSPYAQLTTKYHKYIPNEGMSGTHVQLVPAASKDAIFYPVSGSAVTFTAFAPYPASSGSIATLSETNKTLTLGLGEQKSATGTNIMEQIDFIHHKGTDPYTQKNPVATLNFEHKLSRVIINLTPGANYSGSLSGSTAKITGVFTTAVCNIATGAITSASGDGNITPFRTTNADANQVFQTIVAPQTASSSPAATSRKLTITIDSKAYTLEMPEDWTSGNSYTYNYVFGPTGVSLAGCTVTNWGSSTIDNSIGGNDLPAGWQDEIDWNNVVFDGESNCYIVPPSGQVLIPISRAKTFADSAHGQDIDGAGTKMPVIEPGEEFYASVIWTDNTSTLTPRTETRRADNLICLGTGPKGYILVKVGSAKGNAVVGLRKKNSDGTTYTTLWSWHIWVTDDPTAKTYTTTNGYTFMDRNLGATRGAQHVTDYLNGTTITDAKILETYGVHFQWGRKDPFPGSNATTGTTDKTIYGPTGSTTTITKTGIGSTPVSMAASIQAPLSFYWMTSGYEWCSDDVGTTSTRWNNNGLKTLYDPCPAGWRVPVQPAFSTFSTSTLTPWTTKGRNSSSLGWWPAVGLRWGDGRAGGLANVGSFGYCWSATPSPSNASLALNLYFYSSNVGPSYSYNRADGMAVRCVRES